MMKPKIIMASQSQPPIKVTCLTPLCHQGMTRLSREKPTGERAVRSRTLKGKKAFLHQCGQPIIQGTPAEQGGINPYTTIFVKELNANQIRK
jgi:hypothetical protein